MFALYAGTGAGDVPELTALAVDELRRAPRPPGPSSSARGRR